jgi:hypothetical protein
VNLVRFTNPFLAEVSGSPIPLPRLRRERLASRDAIQFLAMKYAVLAVLLAVVQAAPPVPRKASDNQSGTRDNLKDQSQSEPNSSPNQIASNNQNGDAKQGAKPSAQPAANDANKTVVVAELASMPKKDRWDKASVIASWILVYFTFLLVVIGTGGVFAAIMTLKAIDKQAATMQGQLAQAIASTKAAQDSIDIIKDKDRARLHVEPVYEEGFNDFHLDPDEMTTIGPQVGIRVVQHGPTKAFNVIGESIVLLEDSSEALPTLDVSAPMRIPAVIDGGNVSFVVEQYLFPYTIEDSSAIAEGKKFVHFLGRLVYEDVFGNPHKTTFRYLWTPEVRYGGITFEDAVWMKLEPKSDNYAD